MSAIFFKCPHCGQQAESDDAFYGRSFPCAHCHRMAEITDANIILPEIDAPIKPATRRCPACGEEILVSARKCKHCKEWLLNAEESQKYDRHVWVSEKSRGIYIILGLLFGFFGVHNFYAGHLGSAVFELIFFSVLLAFELIFPLSPVLFFIGGGFGLLVVLETFSTYRDGNGNIMR